MWALGDLVLAGRGCLALCSFGRRPGSVRGGVLPEVTSFFEGVGTWKAVLLHTAWASIQTVMEFRSAALLFKVSCLSVVCGSVHQQILQNHGFSASAVIGSEMHTNYTPPGSSHSSGLGFCGGSCWVPYTVRTHRTLSKGTGVRTRKLVIYD